MNLLGAVHQLEDLGWQTVLPDADNHDYHDTVLVASCGGYRLEALYYGLDKGEEMVELAYVGYFGEYEEDEYSVRALWFEGWPSPEQAASILAEHGEFPDYTPERTYVLGTGEIKLHAH